MGAYLVLTASALTAAKSSWALGEKAGLLSRNEIESAAGFSPSPIIRGITPFSTITGANLPHFSARTNSGQPIARRHQGLCGGGSVLQAELLVCRQNDV